MNMEQAREEIRNAKYKEGDLVYNTMTKLSGRIQKIVHSGKVVYYLNNNPYREKWLVEIGERRKLKF